ncbi:hypothetical protein JFY74_04365 [Pectobacterium carotovorum]|nr:hypothetical protein JFY74_04365 [Pectobacterium carotovorum]
MHYNIEKRSRSRYRIDEKGLLISLQHCNGVAPASLKAAEASQLTR